LVNIKINTTLLFTKS